MLVPEGYLGCKRLRHVRAHLHSSGVAGPLQDAEALIKMGGPASKRDQCWFALDIVTVATLMPRSQFKH